MITRAKIHLKDGRIIYKKVEYTNYFVKTEIDGVMMILQPRYFVPDKGGAILELSQYLNKGKTGYQPKWNS